MNASTEASLRALLEYWQATPSPFQQEQVERCERLLKSQCPLDDTQLETYFVRLQGFEGCDFKQDAEGKLTWRCGGGTDKSYSEKILKSMGLDEEQVALMHDYVDALGGHCDCEILMNAETSMLGDEEDDDDEAHVRAWESDGFRLDLFDTCKVDSYGKTLLRYVFADNGQVIFQGEDFVCSPLHAIDSDETVAACLSFFALRPGDTDAEYFADYTEAQRAWMDERAEDLAVVVNDMENPDG